MIGSPVRGSFSSRNFSMIKSVSALYSAGSTMPRGFTPFRLIQILGGEASTSLQYAFVRSQSMFRNDVYASSALFLRLGNASARSFFWREESDYRRNENPPRRTFEPILCRPNLPCSPSPPLL